MPSVLQSASNGASGTSCTATFGTVPISGNMLVAVGNSDATLTISGTWNLRFSYVGSQGFYVWDRVAGASEPSTVTITPSVSDDAALTIYELDGIASFDVVGTVVTATSTNTITAGDITTTGTAGDVVIAVAAMHNWDVVGANPATPTFGGLFTLDQSVTNYSGITAAEASGQFAGSLIQSVAGAVGATTIGWTNNVHDLAAVQVAYKAATGGAGTANFVGAVATATAVGIPGDFLGASDGGTFALRSGAWVDVEQYAAVGGVWA